MSVEVLATQYGTTALPANQGGTNFATSGAKNVNPNTSSNGGFPNAVPTATQISNFLSGNTPAGADLFVVASGGNDVHFALSDLSGFTLPQQNAYIEDQATALASAIKSLQLRGAAHIIVVGQQESFGPTNFRAARQLYDTTLRSALAAQQTKYAGDSVDPVRKDIVANPGLFGIQFFTTAAGHTACPMPDPVLNLTTAWSLLCSGNSPVTQPTLFENIAPLADDEHWSAAGQAVLGSYYNCLALVTWPRTTPPFPVVSLIRASCSRFTEFKSQHAPPR